MRYVLPLRVALFILYFASGHAAVAARLRSLDSINGLLLYAALYAGLALAIVAASFARRPFRLGWAFTLAVASAFIDAHEHVLGDAESYESFLTLVQAAGFAGDAAAQYATAILWAIGRSAVLFAAIALPSPRPLRSGAALLAGIAPAVAIMGLGTLLYMRGGEGARGLPPATTPLAYGLVAAAEWATTPDMIRQDVTLHRRTGAPTRDVVLIVDESIAPAYLDIDDPRGVHSGLAQAQRGSGRGSAPGSKAPLTIANFGFAAAYNNCSAGSNLSLRHGGTHTDYRQVAAAMPSIFAYARKAGYHTVYMDAQRTGGALQNMMDTAERRDIDSFIQFDTVAVRDRDQAAGRALAGRLADTVPDFILVNKLGGHFPVNDKYPDAAMRYRPVLPRGGFMTVSDTGDRTGFDGSPASWVRYRNAYRDTLLWNVGTFFDTLLGRPDLGPATILYTSDHGQDLHEHGRPGSNTHCSASPAASEGVVPLVAIDIGTVPAADWHRAAILNHDRAEHAAIFPTLLSLMGYDDPRIEDLYGPGLTARLPGKLAFNVLYNARLGRAPIWQPIYLADVPRPPDDVKGAPGL